MQLLNLLGCKNPIIGVVHFPPLLGYKDFPGLEVCLKKALKDAKTLEEGGVDAIMVENNYDTPHKEFVSDEVKRAMLKLTLAVSEEVSVPLGICVLWNDYKSALDIAKESSAKFIRVPVFVDSVETSYGKIYADARAVLNYRKKLGAEHIALFTDIHVKHAEMLHPRSLTESAKEAVEKGSDGIIVTGKWTGDAPNTSDLKEAREAVGADFPVLIGSGATKNNVDTLLRFADGIIVGTALKTGQVRSKEEETNLKPWQEEISLEKTKEFVAAFKSALK